MFDEMKVEESSPDKDAGCRAGFGRTATSVGDFALADPKEKTTPARFHHLTEDGHQRVCNAGSRNRKQPTPSQAAAERRPVAQLILIKFRSDVFVPENEMKETPA